MDAAPTSQPRRRRQLSRCTAAAIGAGLLLAACTPPEIDEPETIVETDPRIPEIREARAALASPVPELLARARALRDVVAEVWALDESSAAREDAAAAVDTGALTAAAAALEEVDLEGEGPDVAAAADVVAAMVETAGELQRAASAELSGVEGLADFDQRLGALVETWDARGSYSAQLRAFDEAATAGEQLAAEATANVPSETLSCVGTWSRRAEAATVYVERTRELRDLISRRRGQQFDELRRAYGEDPFDSGGPLPSVDGQIGASCWADESELPGLVAGLELLVGQLEAALDPEDLRG